MNIVVFQNNMLMRRNLVQTVGFRNERVKYYEELDYILRISRTHRVCFVDVPTYKLRFHAGQISSTSGTDGHHVWLRKQQELLRLVKRQMFADGLYYQAHRARLDRCLSRLHRAVAVPLMLANVPRPKSRVYSRRARMHLARCAQLRHSYPTLWCLTFAPVALRRFAAFLSSKRRAVYRTVGSVDACFNGHDLGPDSSRHLKAWQGSVMNGVRWRSVAGRRSSITTGASRAPRRCIADRRSRSSPSERPVPSKESHRSSSNPALAGRG